MVKGISEVKKLAKEYKEELKRHNIHVSRMILYGSYAKGNPRPYSDIDLVVVSSDLARYSPVRRQEVLAQLTMDIDAPLEVIGYTPQELRGSGSTIFGQIIRQTGKTIF